MIPSAGQITLSVMLSRCIGMFQHLQEDIFEEIVYISCHAFQINRNVSALSLLGPETGTDPGTIPG